MNAKGMRGALCGIAISVGKALQKKRTPYLIILRFSIIFPLTMKKCVPCKLCSALITDVSLKCCDHGNLFI